MLSWTICYFTLERFHSKATIISALRYNWNSKTEKKKNITKCQYWTFEMNALSKNITKYQFETDFAGSEP